MNCSRASPKAFEAERDMTGTIGVSFDGFQSLRESLAVAREAVAAGARSLWMAEHLGYREPMTSCMAFALSFPGIKVVPTAISPFLRHPMPTAMAMATLAEANDGHAAIAIGVGNPMFLGESGLSIEKPVRALRESAETLRALWTGEAVEREDMLHRLKGARLAFKPPPIPIYLAPMKEQMLRLAGRIADGVVLSAGLSAGFVTRSLGFVEEERAKAGRAAEPFVKAGYVYLLASRSPKGGVETLRMKLAFLMRNRYIDDNLAFSGIPIDQQAIMDAISRRGLAEAARLVPEEAVHAFTITGSAEQCREGIERFLKAGLSEIVLILTGEPEDFDLAYSVIREFAGGR
jgi:5,10-methylenetetrahydromethanopterin reductase